MDTRMLVLVLLLTTSLASPSALADAVADDRRPPPKSGEQGKIDRAIHQKYKAEFASRAAGDRDALAHQLRDAASTEKDSAARYVLLMRAKDCAVNAGDFLFMFTVVDDIAKQYRINGEEMKASGISMGLDVSSLPADELGEAYYKAAETALADWNADLASKANFMVRRAAPSNRELILRSDALQRTIRQRNHELLEVAAAGRKLSLHPEDSAASLLVGKHLCFNENKWEQGLVFLAHGADPRLSELARQDLAGPSDAGAMATLADGWWAVDARRRAAYWYAKALPGLEGGKKAGAEKRIEEAGAADKAQ